MTVQSHELVLLSMTSNEIIFTHNKTKKDYSLPQTRKNILFSTRLLLLVILIISGLMLAYYAIPLLIKTNLSDLPDTIFSQHTLSVFVITIFSLLLTVQSTFSIITMLYGWSDAEMIEKNKAPKSFLPPTYSFTAIIPAKNEEQVIGDTIRAVSAMDYPDSLKEIIIVCHADDQGTIAAAQTTMRELDKRNIQIILFTDPPINKPHGLNAALAYAQNDIVVVFDAEDEPNKQLYHTVNTVFATEKVDVVQSGVQLINFSSAWYGMLNVLEYYFWFKSVLQFYSHVGLIPLGGNTVFFKTSWLKKIKGWNEHCLTEDADIGIRLSSKGANIRVIYDEKQVTKEEIPTNLLHFIKQRTRWNQGFLSILLDGNLFLLPRRLQRFLAFYILSSPFLQTFLFAYVLFSLFLLVSTKLPVIIAMLYILPFYTVILQLILYSIGFYEFCKEYHVRYSPVYLLTLIASFYPFQLVLGISAIRAVIRTLLGNTKWEKTVHINAHRVAPSAL